VLAANVWTAAANGSLHHRNTSKNQRSRRKTIKYDNSNSPV